MLPRTPFYYYDTALLQATLDAITSTVAAYPHFHVHYALKANANPKLLRLIQQAGLGVDCVSGGEVQVGIDNGFDAAKIVYAGVGKSNEEILLALQHDIFCFNVESVPELEVINELAEQVGKVANVCLRINPDVEAHTHAHIVTGKAENKFGIALGDMMHVIDLAKTLSHIRFLGLHFHIGSQITDMQDYLDLCERVNDIQDHLNEEGVYPSVINVGGGLGIDYHDPDKHPIPDFKTYFGIFADHLHLRDGQSVHFELGRSIVAQCGTLIARVLYVKQAESKQFAIIDAGMTELIRPALYQAHHQIQNISSQSIDYQIYDVVGPICESSDVFDRDVLLPPIKRGDLIAIRSAGAYGETMASTYNCRKLPASYTTEDFPLPLT
ncbi:MAG: diaminopimelate decarboxylase [Paludibacteraceae bacterium]|nr:diaminopimelate decarboxylase [Paludibacteraceae bacterium]